MGQKGIFSAVLVIVFVSAILAARAASSGFADGMGMGVAYAIEAERAAFVRSELERNFDFVVADSLTTGIASGKISGNVLRVIVADAMLAWAEEQERIHNEVPVHFGMAPAYNPADSALGEISNEALIETTSVLVIRYGTGICAAEFVYTGGLLRDKVLVARVESANYSQLFMVPVGYTRVVVAPCA